MEKPEHLTGVSVPLPNKIMLAGSGKIVSKEQAEKVLKSEPEQKIQCKGCNHKLRIHDTLEGFCIVCIVRRLKVLAAIEIAESKPEPTEFIKENRDFIKDANRDFQAGRVEGNCVQDYVRALRELGKACVRLESQAEQLKEMKFLREEFKREEKKVLKLIDILAAKDKEIERLGPFLRFYRHIERHLRPDDEVVCKICGKSLPDIEQALKEDK